MARVIRKSDPYVKEDNAPVISLKLGETEEQSLLLFLQNPSPACPPSWCNGGKIAEEMRGHDLGHIRISRGRSPLAPGRSRRLFSLGKSSVWNSAWCSLTIC